MSLQVKIAEICDQVYQKQPSKIEVLDSLTNFVFKITFEQDKPPIVLKIINRESVNHFLFRSLEIEKILKEKGYLSEWILHETPEYRIERFIPNEPMDTDRFRAHHTRLLLMRHLAEFHALDSTTDPTKVQILDTWKTVFSKIESKIAQNLEGRLEELQVRQILNHFTDFVLKDLIPFTLSEEIVLCHNDMLSGNVLFDLEKEQMALIDFEYGGYSFPANDIYNMLIESTYDYSLTDGLGYEQDMKTFPTDSELKEIIRFYLFFRNNWKELKNTKDHAEVVESYRNDPRMKEIQDSDVEKHFKSFFLLGNITNLYWSVWSFFIFKKEGKVFDYLQFGLQRYKDFLWGLEKYNEVNKQE